MFDKVALNTRSIVCYMSHIGGGALDNSSGVKSENFVRRDTTFGGSALHSLWGYLSLL